MDMSSTKHLKEQFVSNLTGSSMLEVATLSVLVPVVVVLRKWCGICEKKGIELKKNGNVVTHKKVWHRFIILLAMDFLFVVVPILAFLTILSGKVYICTFLLSVMVIVILLAKRSWSSTIIHGLGDRSYLRINLSSYRVLMMIVTCLCILAVDFNIFPRRYAKTETYGTSLMDLGVGSFVVANSLVSRQARNVMSVNWKYAFRSTTPPLILGVVRLLTTAGVDYQVHVGEYGAHWNFFFTLAAVFMLTSFINMHPKYCGVTALLILIAYQACLLCGLNEYLLSNNRALDIISQNKEGLFSIFGYWGMHLAGVYLGYMLFQSESTVMKLSIQMTRTRAWMLAMMFWLATVILDKYVERVSRRMCNLAYVTLVFAQNFQVLAILLVSDIGQLLVLEEAMNREMLGTFLLANALTGLVNLYVDTLSTSSLAAFLILLGYSATLSAAIGIASFCNFKLKIW